MGRWYTFRIAQYIRTGERNADGGRATAAIRRERVSQSRQTECRSLISSLSLIKFPGIYPPCACGCLGRRARYLEKASYVTSQRRLEIVAMMYDRNYRKSMRPPAHGPTPRRGKRNSRRNDTSVADFDEVPAKENARSTRDLFPWVARFLPRIPSCTPPYPADGQTARECRTGKRREASESETFPTVALINRPCVYQREWKNS